MNRRNFPKRVLATALIAALGLGQAVSAQEGHAHEKQGASQNDASPRLHKTMSGHKMPTMTGNVDQDFASMMIVHHQHAVDMVDVLMKEGSSAELKAMGQRMKTTQQAEIRQLAKFAGTPEKAKAEGAHDHAGMGMGNGMGMGKGMGMGMGDHHADHAKSMDKHFKALDANGDGNISRAEFDAGHKK